MRYLLKRANPILAKVRIVILSPPIVFETSLPAKDRINDFPNYLINRAKKLRNLYIFTNTTATMEAIENLKPDVIVNATGATPLLPPITGLHDRVDKENSKVLSILPSSSKIIPTINGTSYGK